MADRSTRRTLSKRDRRDQRSKGIILPSVVIVALITQIPFLITLVISLLKWNLKRPDLGARFGGISNFVSIFTSSAFYQVLLNTVAIIAATLVLCTVIATLLALLLNRNFYGVHACRTLIILPYFVMDAVVGIVWKTLILNSSFGLSYYISRFFGQLPIDFFGRYPLQTIIALIVWQWVPFFYMIIIAGLQNISEDVIESARIDGAHGLNMLFRIQIPLIGSHIGVAMTLGLINILKVFGLVYVTTQGGPGLLSANLPYYVYRTIFFDWNVGKAAAISVVTVAITILVVQSFFKMISRGGEDRA